MDKKYLFILDLMGKLSWSSGLSVLVDILKLMYVQGEINSHKVHKNNHEFKSGTQKKR